MLLILNLLITISLIKLIIYILIKKDIIKWNAFINNKINKIESIIKEKTWKDPFIMIIWITIIFILLVYIISLSINKEQEINIEKLMDEIQMESERLMNEIEWLK